MFKCCTKSKSGFNKKLSIRSNRSNRSRKSYDELKACSEGLLSEVQYSTARTRAIQIISVIFQNSSQRNSGKNQQGTDHTNSSGGRDGIKKCGSHSMISQFAKHLLPGDVDDHAAKRRTISSNNCDKLVQNLLSSSKRDLTSFNVIARQPEATTTGTPDLKQEQEITTIDIHESEVVDIANETDSLKPEVASVISMETDCFETVAIPNIAIEITAPDTPDDDLKSTSLIGTGEATLLTFQQAAETSSLKVTTASNEISLKVTSAAGSFLTVGSSHGGRARRPSQTSHAPSEMSHVFSVCRKEQNKIQKMAAAQDKGSDTRSVRSASGTGPTPKTAMSLRLQCFSSSESGRSLFLTANEIMALTKSWHTFSSRPSFLIQLVAAVADEPKLKQMLSVEMGVELCSNDHNEVNAIVNDVSSASDSTSINFVKMSWDHTEVVKNSDTENDKIEEVTTTVNRLEIGTRSPDRTVKSGYYFPDDVSANSPTIIGADDDNFANAIENVGQPNNTAQYRKNNTPNNSDEKLYDVQTKDVKTEHDKRGADNESSIYEFETKISQNNEQQAKNNHDEPADCTLNKRHNSPDNRAVASSNCSSNQNKISNSDETIVGGSIHLHHDGSNNPEHKLKQKLDSKSLEFNSKCPRCVMDKTRPKSLSNTIKNTTSTKKNLGKEKYSPSGSSEVFSNLETSVTSKRSVSKFAEIKSQEPLILKINHRGEIITDSHSDYRTVTKSVAYSAKEQDECFTSTLIVDHHHIEYTDENNTVDVEHEKQSVSTDQEISLEIEKSDMADSTAIVRSNGSPQVFRFPPKDTNVMDSPALKENSEGNGENYGDCLANNTGTNNASLINGSNIGNELPTSNVGNTSYNSATKRLEEGTSTNTNQGNNDITMNDNDSFNRTTPAVTMDLKDSNTRNEQNVTESTKIDTNLCGIVREKIDCSGDSIKTNSFINFWSRLFMFMNSSGTQNALLIDEIRRMGRYHANVPDISFESKYWLRLKTEFVKTINECISEIIMDEFQYGSECDSIRGPGGQNSSRRPTKLTECCKVSQAQLKEDIKRHIEIWQRFTNFVFSEIKHAYIEGTILKSMDRKNKN